MCAKVERDTYLWSCNFKKIFVKNTLPKIQIIVKIWVYHFPNKKAHKKLGPKPKISTQHNRIEITTLLSR